MAQFAPTQNLVINNFHGIRTRNVKTGLDGSISADVAINVELEIADDGSGIDLKTSKGNTEYFDINDYVESLSLTNPEIIDVFETEQDGVKYIIIYLIDDVLNGCLLCLEPDMTCSIIKSGISTDTDTNGITMRSTAYDVFVFTNGTEYYSYSHSQTIQVTKLEPEYDGVAVTGSALCEYRGSLVIGCDNGVLIGSRQGDITDWDYTDVDETKAWYQLFYKKITAVVPYIDGMLVFMGDSSVMLSGNLSYATDAKRSDASIGGCMNNHAWVLHDKYLFFYDNNQKNIYYYLQNDIGEKVLGSPVADEIQKYLSDIKDIQFTSYIGDSKSEIWINITYQDDTKKILIYNYLQQEYTERCMNEIKGIRTYDFNVISFNIRKIYLERKGAANCVFDGIYIPAVYRTPYINFGSYSNLKEEDLKPLITYGKSFNNTFSVRFFNEKKSKYKSFELHQGLDSEFSDDSSKTSDTPDRELWDYSYFPDEKSKIVGTVKAKAPSSFYYLGFEIFTEHVGEDFCIKQVEFKELTQEQDTIGAK